MNYVDIGAQVSDNNWERIEEHSTIEKSVLIGILDHGLMLIGNSENFMEDLCIYAEIQLKGIININQNMRLFAPVTSILVTTNELLNLIVKKRDGSRTLFMKTLRQNIIKSTKVTYVPPYRTVGNVIELMEVDLRFTASNPPDRAIKKLIVDHKAKMILALIGK